MLDQDQLDRVAATAARAAERAKPLQNGPQATHSLTIKGSPGRDLIIGGSTTGHLGWIALITGLLIICMMSALLLFLGTARSVAAMPSNAHLKAVNAALAVVSICKSSDRSTCFDLISQTKHFAGFIRLQSAGSVAVAGFRTNSSRLFPAYPGFFGFLIPSVPAQWGVGMWNRT